MAPPPPLRNPTHDSTSRDTSTGFWANLRRWHTQWKTSQGMAPKLLFMTGFLINSTALGGLFFLLNHDFEQLNERETKLCVPFKDLYMYSTDLAMFFFFLISIIVFLLMCLMQCKHQKLENSAYNLISLLGSTTLIFSSFLVLISVSGFLRTVGKTKCDPQSSVVSELKLRYVFQSAASLITSLIYTVVGISLVKRQAQLISPVPPPTPIYQIRPPEFDNMFPPPPTYQQSELYHQQRMNR